MWREGIFEGTETLQRRNERLDEGSPSYANTVTTSRPTSGTNNSRIAVSTPVPSMTNLMITGTPATPVRMYI